MLKKIKPSILAADWMVDMERSAGILLPIFSLASDYGIGSMGKNAYEFIDFLHAGGQRWWQILPVGPTGGGDSPYTALSTFAGNPLLIDLPLLVEENFLTKEDLAQTKVDYCSHIDYQTVEKQREALLHKAFSCVDEETRQGVS